MVSREEGNPLLGPTPGVGPDIWDLVAELRNLPIFSIRSESIGLTPVCKWQIFARSIPMGRDPYAKMGFLLCGGRGRDGINHAISVRWQNAGDGRQIRYQNACPNGRGQSLS